MKTGEEVSVMASDRELNPSNHNLNSNTAAANTTMAPTISPEFAKIYQESLGVRVFHSETKVEVEMQEQKFWKGRRKILNAFIFCACCYLIYRNLFE